MAMPLVELLSREAGASRQDLAVATLASGAANGVMIAVINQAAASARYGALNGRLLAIFLAALALYVLGLRFVFASATGVVEQMLMRMRVRLMQRIADAELLVLHEVGKPRIFQAITQDTTLISESQGMLVAAAHSVVMVGFTGIYVLTVSAPALLTIVGVIVAGVLLYLARGRELLRLVGAGTAESVRFLDLTSDLVDGLKEIRLSQARRSAVLAELRRVAVRLRDVTMRATSVYNENAVFSQAFFYILIAIIVFVLPRLVVGFAREVPELVATVLFVIGPLSTIVTAVPSLNKANEAARSLMALEGAIGRAGVEPVAPEASSTRVQPMVLRDTIECRGIVFGYPGSEADAFSIGPIDLIVRHGEITMVIGGNGSGKTTLLKVIAGLYTPAAGSLLLDEVTVTPERQASYREMFGAIFSDFHLFRRLYGVDASPDAVAARFDQMKIAGKIAYRDGGFSTVELSTGQRKRVALAVVLLEDRPVMIFDEWAAEQDPEFRASFYETLLPELRRAGKTLLVATHDDRYFAVADTIVKMEFGRVQTIERRDRR